MDVSLSQIPTKISRKNPSIPKPIPQKKYERENS
jgi:hypothetical protein